MKPGLAAELAEYDAAVRLVVQAARLKFMRHLDDSGRGKEGWAFMHAGEVRQRISDEADELDQAWRDGDPGRIMEEAGDVVNFAVFGAKSAGGVP